MSVQLSWKCWKRASVRLRKCLKIMGFSEQCFKALFSGGNWNALCLFMDFDAFTPRLHLSITSIAVPHDGRISTFLNAVYKGSIISVWQLTTSVEHFSKFYNFSQKNVSNHTAKETHWYSQWDIRFKIIKIYVPHFMNVHQWNSRKFFSAHAAQLWRFGTKAM